jgi:hypothetical protein
MIFSLFQRACLNPADSLRRQLLLSFGLPAFLTIAFVVSLAVAFAHKAGVEVQDRAGRVLEEQVITKFVRSSSHVAEHISSYIDSVDRALQLMAEVTRDRIVGYPEPGWEDDLFVPFFDTETQRNMYPLKSPPPPLDWNITPNVNDENMKEHIPNVEPKTVYEHFYDGFESPSGATASGISTANGVYLFQGSCDPNEHDPVARGYLANCTDEHNNMETGGILQPTNTSKWLQQKAGDLSVLIKPLYEAQPDVMLAGIYFVNSGAGSTLWYPGHKIKAGAYTSEGCDWMRQTNPYTNAPFATDEEIARCHPEGEVVPIREYNPLERPWFRDCIENDGDFRWHGPFRAFDSGVPLVSVSSSLRRFVVCPPVMVILTKSSFLLGLSQRFRSNVSYAYDVLANLHLFAGSVSHSFTNISPMYTELGI